MKRKQKKPTAIITGDIEIRSHTPLCRTDDYFEALKKKIEWLSDLQQKYLCPIFDGGDLFDKKYKQYPSHSLLGWAVNHLPNNMYTVPGNHDLPGKSIDNYSNSAMAVLEESGVVQVPYPSFIPTGDIGIYGFPWGVELKQPTVFQSYNVALIHAMVYDEFEPFPGCEGYSKKELLKIFPDFDLIVCGHHHQTFTGTRKNTILINPGSLMRNDADQMDHKPCVFLWYAEENRVEKVYVPIEQGVVTRAHIDEVKKKEQRLDAFVEKLGEQTITGINFEANLEIACAGLNKKITDKIWQYFEG